MTLVLDGGDLTFSNPVDGDISVEGLRGFDDGGLSVQSKVGFLEFFSREIGEEGKTQSTGGIVLDGFEVLGEDFHSEDFSVGVGELLTEGLLVELPLLDDVFVNLNIGKGLLVEQEDGSAQENGTSQSEDQEFVHFYFY